MKAEELRAKSIEELQTFVGETSKALFAQRMKNQAGKLDDTNSMSSLRHDIARAKTIIAEKQKGTK